MSLMELLMPVGRGSKGTLDGGRCKQQRAELGLHGGIYKAGLFLGASLILSWFWGWFVAVDRKGSGVA